MKIVILMAALVIAYPVFGQAVQHAPTKDVCQADVVVWYSHEISTEYYNAQAAWVTDSKPNNTEIGRMPITGLLARMSEMND